MSNPRQRVHTVRDLEKFLRKRGFTRPEARAIVHGGWRALAAHIEKAQNDKQISSTRAILGGALITAS